MPKRTQPFELKKLITNPDNHIYYNPQITDKSIIEFLDDNNIELGTNINKVPESANTYAFLANQWKTQYQHHRIGKLYVASELGIANYNHAMQKAITKAQNVHGPFIYHTQNHGFQLNINSFHALAGNLPKATQLYQKSLQHQYQHQADHLISYELYYNDNQKDNILMIETLNYQYESQNYHIFRSDNYQNIGLSSMELERLSHPLIQQVNQLMDTYNKLNIDGLDDLNQYGKQAARYIVEETLYPTAALAYTYRNLWLYQDAQNKWVLTPHTWLTELLKPMLGQLSIPQQQYLLNEIYGIWGNEDVSIYDNPNDSIHNFTDDLDRYAPLNPINFTDHLIAYSSKRPSKPNNPLPVLNQNSFVKQLSTLVDNNLYYNAKQPNKTYDTPHLVTNFDIKLSQSNCRNSLNNQIFNDCQSMNKNIIIDRQPIYYTHGILYQITSRPISVIIFVTKHDSQDAANEFDQIVNHKPYQIVTTHFVYASGYAYYIGTRMTNHNSNNYMVIPMQSGFDTNSPDLSLPNNQRSLTTLSPFNWDYYHDLQVSMNMYGITTNWVTNEYIAFYLVYIKPINNAKDPAVLLKHQHERKQAILTDPQFQKYILNE